VPDRNKIDVSKKVSVIIPCYNHACYLPKAVRSVLDQSYPNIEIIVVDDGSSDNTRAVAENFDAVTYVYQENQGLSAARNSGIAASSGSYLVFLDADDWLLTDAIAINVKYFREGANIGLVSGNYINFYEKSDRYRLVEKEQKQNVYADLLYNNHLMMHGSLMFPRFVFDRFQYDIHLRSSEDWDMTLHICRHYPIVQHNEPISVRRKVPTSMSRNYVTMLNTSLRVLQKQKQYVRTDAERLSLQSGRKRLKKNFTLRIYQEILKRGTGKEQEVRLLLKYRKDLYFKYVLKVKLLHFFQRRQAATL
jgi:glycosyltransferase involved in cell wall biosynthesis